MAKTKVHGEFLKDSVVRFTAKAGENITKGQAVYISGVSGEKPVVSLADADDTAKMPAFGLAEATVSTNAEVEITSFGTLGGLDTSSYSLGDILYVDTTAGSLTNNPSGLEATKLQNIGMVQRVHATSGSIKVGGAGRTNAVPNLDDGDIFIGDSNNKAISSPLSTEIESYLDGGTSTPILTSLTVASDTDATIDIGRAKIGYMGFTDFAGFAHRDNATTTNYALLQYNTGETYLNAASGRDINFRINNSNVGVFKSSGNFGIGDTSPEAILHVSGVAPTYTNNATVFYGGTTNNGAMNGVSLWSSGDALSGGISSNLLFANSSTPSQTNTNRSSGTIYFGNTTTASRTSDMIFGGYYKGTTSFVERMRIDSLGDVNIGTTAAATGSHKLVVESASTTGTVNSHIALIGDSATVGQGPQILFSESGDGQAYAGGTIGFTRTGGNSQGALLFGTRGSSGDANTTTTERMRIDSSGNLLVGTTDVDLGFTDGDDGFAVNPAGYVQSARSSTNANLYLNKLDYDGDIIDFRKDGTTVGSIGSRGTGTQIYFGSGDTGLLYVPASDAILPFNTSTNVPSNNVISLGGSGDAFKDLYLSGTANVGKADVITSIQPELHFSSTYSYSNNRDWRFITNNFGNGNWGGFSLERSTGAQGSPSVAMFGIDLSGNMGVGVGGASGGAQPQAKLDVGGTIRTSTGILFGSDTAAANTLDDYEEGTWTPVMHSSGGSVSASYSYRSAYYIKIGNSVYVRWGFRLSSRSGGSGHAQVTGLPFTSKNYGSYQQPAAFVNAQNLTTDPDGPVLFYLVDNNTKIEGRLMNNADTGLPISYFQNGSWCIGHFTYDVS